MFRERYADNPPIKWSGSVVPHLIGRCRMWATAGFTTILSTERRSMRSAAFHPMETVDNQQAVATGHAGPLSPSCDTVASSDGVGVVAARGAGHRGLRGRGMGQAPVRFSVC